MKSTKFTMVVVMVSSLVISGCIVDDDDDHNLGSSSLDVAPVTHLQYQAECGNCHMAYQPGFLPARSWEKLMATLDDHFGENAELDDESRQQLVDYLMSNGADHANYKRSQGIMRSLGDQETPLRISKTRYFVHKHDELPRNAVEGNPQVKSFSRCEVCHQQADKGLYNEHQVRIPGIGRWDD